VNNLVRLGAALRPALIEARLARVLALAANRPPDEDAGLSAAERQALEARATRAAGGARALPQLAQNRGCGLGKSMP